MIDSDLADLYGVETRALNQAVKRNAGRFPEDFMFRLSPNESAALRSQIVILGAAPVDDQPVKRGKHRKILSLRLHRARHRNAPSVLTSQRAIDVNIAIMRTFVRLRHLLATHHELAQQLESLQWRQEEQGQQIQTIFETIQHLIEAPIDEPRRRIGFAVDQIS